MLAMDQKAVAGVKFRAIQRLRNYVAEADDAAAAQVDEAHAEVTVPRVWRSHRLSCLKRSTLGTYLLDILEEPWNSYTKFHLDVVACPPCRANLQDLQDEESGGPRPMTDSIFASSVGFLSRTAGTGCEPP
jgi:hypothetical protein